eukprot:CAMPEP_0170534702 /NCGR_PEP_ID=MMETSP0209-20121228/94007_1 /TAXON_ID=665100 ORGANISM="Litonotus pictus, Strain P1" /NCGR_SAMPLE_ID=MMETSP0209 /ASSEMBLY_ACC=CAM_ASM_000301 /LENGTH=44 /DNA_ID= /DNA_START= /DNA_END= /DNA_ORIENTATION=
MTAKAFYVRRDKDTEGNVKRTTINLDIDSCSRFFANSTEIDLEA